MQDKFSYQEYVTDETFLAEYNAYQQKYAQNIRESDKVIIKMVRALVEERRWSAAPKLLDIGCSTGNLLLHLKQLVPALDLTGCDLAKSSLEACRHNPQLSGITFSEMDMLHLGARDAFDIVVANAVAVYFDWVEYEKGLRSVWHALRPGGAYIAFEWLHPFVHQDLIIYERTMGHPRGIQICFRPISKVSDLMRRVGFGGIEFSPFVMPIDLPRPDDDEEVLSYTVKNEQGERMTFRGALYQPWCHVLARKGRVTRQRSA